VKRRAAFLDRDGTIIRDTHYIADPADVRLLPGAARAVRRLNESDVAVVVITNQSGIARGLVTVEQYAAVQRKLASELAAEGARLDATYHCPHYPSITGACRCRKPGRELYDRAIADLGLEPRGALFVGDRWHDVLPARVFEGSAYFLQSPETPRDEAERADREVTIVASLLEAVEDYLRQPATGPLNG
jgi:histidinol-phosphate phosphatase family protein